MTKHATITMRKLAAFAAACLLALAVAPASGGCSASAAGKVVKTTRPKLKPAKEAEADCVMEASDTIWHPSSIVISGYEKALRSRKESLLATNEGDSAVARVALVIDYLDTDGRQVHQAEVVLDCDLPPGQTRMLVFPSWDAQCVWYYEKSAPLRPAAPATPYRVSVDVKYAIVQPQNHDQ